LPCQDVDVDGRQAGLRARGKAERKTGEKQNRDFHIKERGATRRPFNLKLYAASGVRFSSAVCKHRLRDDAYPMIECNIMHFQIRNGKQPRQPKQGRCRREGSQNLVLPARRWLGTDPRKI